ncbi:MAG: CRISPR-associated endonuclease Cas1 [Clostridiales bacterium]|nr:CRISPR-associated endonuclease Cas1 [Clostridiales bacterium]
MVIYVREQGSMVQKKGERIAVSRRSETLLEMPVSNVEGIALIGNVQISTQALHFLLEKGVDISYYSFGGKYLGQTAAESSRNIFLRFAQYEMYRDETKRLDMAKSIVDNKISNQISMIRRHRWQHDTGWKEEVAQIERNRSKIPMAETTNELMGIEGICSSLYFRAYGRMFQCEFEFHGRNRRPPKDSINVIISLGYTFLTREICNVLEAESFESYLGFLHGIRYGRKSLALDIIEGYRQPVIDRLTLRLFNKQMLSKYDFEMEEDRATLNTGGFRKFCKEYDRWMKESSWSGRDTGFRSLIRQEISQLKKAIQKGGAYTSFCWEDQNVYREL